MSTPRRIGSEADGPRVLFVCSGRPKDGLGHLMRTIAVAAAMPPAAPFQIVAVGGATARVLL
jgi:spore coat polysaccharide biosynthesis predicted glycosyltransferase SpsG